MFDCGEGAQRQMIEAKVGFHQETKICITHMHGDHVLGLPGLLQTMAMLDRKGKLQIYGPPGIRRFLECIRKTVQFALTFQVETHEIREAGTVCEEEDYLIQAVWANHSIQSLAYALTEKPRPGKFSTEKAQRLGVPEGPLWSRLQQGREVKLANGQVVKPRQVLGPSRAGRKIVYTGDTSQFRGFARLAASADLLIHDATFDDNLAEKAKEYGHSTPGQAAKNAKKAKVKQLILTHISARYDDATKLVEQANKIFKETRVAEDFMRIEIPLLDS
jgi:ribonuclease Z